jgi:hypothetical protein
MIEEMRLTIPGEELRRLLQQRLDDHRRRADRWKHERARTEKDQTWSRRNTKNAPAWDSIWVGWRRPSAKSCHDSVV